jgi:hypothetical protein
MTPKQPLKTGKKNKITNINLHPIDTFRKGKALIPQHISFEDFTQNEIPQEKRSEFFFVNYPGISGI